MSVPARKRFGQHFLTDQGVIAELVDAISPSEQDRLIEIGPGRAALTHALLERIPSMSAIEIDRDLVRLLARRFTAERLTLIEADVLEIDFSMFAGGQKIRLVGNLPYNISSPLLIHLISARALISDQHFMLQKEVVDRISAQPGQSAYGRLTVLLQAYFQVQPLFDVPPSAFDPPPKVTSAVIRMRPWPERTDAADSAPLRVEYLEQVTARAFAQKRKIIRNTFLPWLNERGLDTRALDPQARAEEIPVQTYIGLARELAQRHC